MSKAKRVGDDPLKNLHYDIWVASKKNERYIGEVRSGAECRLLRITYIPPFF